MKKLKLLPSMLMLIVCVAVLCVGVFSLTPTENTIGGTINISSMARVKLSCYVNEELIYGGQNTAYGVDWDLTETALNFDVSSYADADEVPLRTIRIHIQNLTGLHLGVYFYNGQESTLQTIDGEKYATYDSLKLSDAVYKANAEETDENKLVDIVLSPYGYIAPANSDNTYDEYDMFINFDVVNLDITEVSKVLSYMLRIEKYKSNVTIDGSNNATFTPLEGKTKQLGKLPTNNTNTTAPMLADASYGNVVIPTSYTSIPENWLGLSTTLMSIAIPQSITSLGTEIVLGTSILAPVDWHAINANSSGYAVFASRYTTLNISSSVSSLQVVSDLVHGQSELKNVHISNGITDLVGDAFYMIESLTKITLPNSLISIGWLSFAGCSRLKTIILPESLTSLANAVFWGCTGLSALVIPKGVALISEGLLNGCTGLTSITIPDSVTKIDYNAFSGCSNLTSIFIPSTVTTISAPNVDGSPFYNCSSTLVINTDVASAEAVPSGWGAYWNYYSSSGQLTVNYNQPNPNN